MKKELLENLIKENKSFNTIAKELNLSLSTIRYWCKKFNLKSNYTTFSEGRVSSEYGEFRYCPGCQKNCDTENFYNRRNKKNSSSYCKDCVTIRTNNRIVSVKEQMVEYKGGSCVRCGYNKYVGALEFHHLNPIEKDFNLSRLKKNRFDDLVMKELDKCILVCSNCHREIHEEIRKTN